MTKDKPIAFFDSGVGGLTVFEKVKKILPNENYIYFGDLKHIPYGEKSQQELIKFADEIFKFFEKKEAKAVVMACNTTSAAVYEQLKDNYNFKVYPIIQSCAKIIAQVPLERVGVFATAVTINSSAYARELHKHNRKLQVFEMACPEWVKIVEEKTQNEPQNIELIKSGLEKMFKNKPDKIILGCTHYPYLLDILTKFAPKDLFIDPSESFAKFIKEDLTKRNLLNPQSIGEEKFYVSANATQFLNASKMFYKVKKLPQIVEL